MSVYQLASLQLSTVFDRPTRHHPLPITLDQRVEESLALIDGAVRAPHRLARLVRPAAMLGMALQRPTDVITVRVWLRVDDLSTEMWHDHTLGTRATLKKSAEAKDEEPERPDVSARHRMLVISAQGRTVGAAALNLRPVDGGVLRQLVEFQLAPDLVGADGLLMVGLESSRAEQVWPHEGAMVDGAVGVAVGRIELELGADAIPPAVACGRHDDKGAFVTAETGFFVVNPGVPDDGYELEVSARGLGGDRLRGRRARVKHPVRAVKELAEDRGLDLTGEIVIDVRDLEGDEVPGATVSGSSVRVPAGVGPVLVRPRKLSAAGEPVHVDWAVRVG